MNSHEIDPDSIVCVTIWRGSDRKLAVNVDDENWLYRLYMPHTFLPAAVPSVVVNFNDTRCADGGSVCPTDSLLFTCTGNETITLALRVILPSGDELIVTSSGAVIAIGDLSDGFSVESTNVAVNDGGTSFNYTLSLSIDNASLLAGGVIICNDNTIANRDMAGCPTAGKFYIHT